jgi:hypothetical protein
MKKFIVIYTIAFIDVLTLLFLDIDMFLPEDLDSTFTTEQIKLILLFKPSLFVLLFGGLGCLAAPRLGFSSILAGVNRDSAKIDFKEIFHAVLLCNFTFLINSYWLIKQLHFSIPDLSNFFIFLTGSISDEVIYRWGFISIILVIMNKFLTRWSMFKTRLNLSIFFSSFLFAIQYLDNVPQIFNPIPSTYFFVFINFFILAFCSGMIFARQSIESSIIFHVIISLTQGVAYYVLKWLKII